MVITKGRSSSNQPDIFIENINFFHTPSAFNVPLILIALNSVKSALLQKRTDHRLLEFRREAAINQRSVEQQRYKR